MRRLVVVVCLLALPAHAVDRASYANDKAAFQAEVDSCDLLNARDILELSTLDQAELKARLPAIRDLFADTKTQRKACYAKAKETLDGVIATGLAYMAANPDDVFFARQNELDLGMSPRLSLRAELSGKLLDSLLDDIEAALASPAKVNKGRVNRARQESFVLESARTRALIRQDMDTVLEQERRQLDLDEADVMSAEKMDVKALARVKLAKAHHHLTRALLAYEDIDTGPRLFGIARLASDFGYATDQFGELFGYSDTLVGMDKNLAAAIAKVADRALVINLDIEGAVRDQRAGTFDEDAEQWLSELYQDLSDVTIETRTLLSQLQAVPVVERRYTKARPKATKARKKKVPKKKAAPVSPTAVSSTTVPAKGAPQKSPAPERER